MRIYLDVCCLNRCFDDQHQARIRFEAEAVTLILDRIDAGHDEWLVSPIMESEIRRTPDSERREKVTALLEHATERIPWTPEIAAAGKAFAQRGLPAMDALHVAAAEGGRCDVLLTTDDVLLRRCAALDPRPQVAVKNPVQWISEVLEP